jgi:hypothetical protein
MSKISPKYLPQISAPIDEVLAKLSEIDCDYEYIKVNPEDLKASQPFTLSDGVYDSINDDMNPIWIDIDLNIIDGHHSWVKSLHGGMLLTAVKINVNFKDACRLLNKIQDIYEYEDARSVEEVESQDAINYYGGDENQFLNNLEESNAEIQQEIPSKNEQTVIAYRKEPIKENSAVGNFFTLQPMEGYGKYQIEFENLLDTHVLGMTYKDGQQPAEMLAKIWFPNVNFEKLGEQYNMPPINLKNKAVAQKAMKMGFDGIKYGDTLIQGLK